MYSISRKRMGNTDSMTCKHFAVAQLLLLIVAIGCNTCPQRQSCCVRQRCCYQNQMQYSSEPQLCTSLICASQPEASLPTSPCTTLHMVPTGPSDPIRATDPTDTGDMVPAPSISPSTMDSVKMLPADELPRNLLPPNDSFPSS